MFFSTLEEIILTSNPYEKIEKFEKFYDRIEIESVNFDEAAAPRIFERASFEDYCLVVDPKDVPRRGALHTDYGRAVTLHAIAHIEYSAIDLALDAAYRFRSMPKDFYIDWLEVAKDECRHFLMIEELLIALGYKYGDFPVHKALFEAGRKTDTLIERMAIVPRFLEANGLDANPKIVKKLARFEDIFAQKIIKALDIILYEEIDHVKKGDRWFKYACELENCGDYVKRYLKIVEKHYPGALGSKVFMNLEAREQAGFSCEELNSLSKKNIC